MYKLYYSNIPDMLRYIIIINILFSVYYDVRHLKKNFSGQGESAPPQQFLELAKGPARSMPEIYKLSNPEPVHTEATFLCQKQYSRAK